MPTPTILPDASNRRVVVPGGTGGVGEGIVRSYLAAGASVIVPTRTQDRADQFRALIGKDAAGRLEVIVGDYTTFTGAQNLARRVQDDFGKIDDVVASVGGWWTGKALWDIGESDWEKAFTSLATAHTALARAFIPILDTTGSYVIIVGLSGLRPVPGSSIVSMQQAALIMMRNVLQAETGPARRVFSLVLGPVMTRHRHVGDLDWVTGAQVGAIAVTASVNSDAPGQEFLITGQTDVQQAFQTLTSASTVSK